MNELLKAKPTPSVIFLQETNIKSQEHIATLSIPQGWTASFNAAPIGHMKGAAIIIHNSFIRERDLHVIYNFSDVQFDIVAIRTRGIIMISLYIHCTVQGTMKDLYNNLSQHLINIPQFDDHGPVVLAGDFNHPRHSTLLLEHMEAFSLYPVSTPAPTHNNGSKLDWIFVRAPLKASNFEMDQQPQDHHILRALLHLPPQVQRTNARKRINYKELEKMTKDERVPLFEAFEEAATNATDITQFYEEFPDIAEDFLGITTTPKPKADRDWKHPEVQRKRLALKRALQQRVVNPLQAEAKAKQVKSCRISYQRTIKDIQRKTEKGIANKVESGIFDLRALLSKYEGPEHQNRIIENPAETINFWTHLFSDDDPLIEDTAPMGKTYSFTAEMVSQAIKETKNKTPGEDGIKLILFKLLTPDTIEALARLYTQMGKEAVLPLWAKKGVGRILYKKGPRSDPGNYRVILIAPLLAKIYDKLLEIKGRELLTAEQMEIYVEQAGFMPKRSTHDCVFQLMSLLDGQKRRKKNGYMIAAFIDFRKAFDMVNHKKLLKALRDQEAPEEWINMLRPMLTGRKMELCNELIDILKGTPQGSPISPLLFIFFINPLLKRLRDGCAGLPFSDDICIRSLGFADDLVLLPANNRDLAKMMTIMMEWAEEFGMSINVDKSKLMIMHGKAATGDLPLSELPMQYEIVLSFKYLGTMLYGRDYRPRQKLLPTQEHIMWKCVHRIKKALNPNVGLPLRRQLQFLVTDVLSTALYSAPTCDLDHDSIDKFMMRQLRYLIGCNNMVSATFLRCELGIIPSKYLAHCRALGYLWNLVNHAWFRHHLTDLHGPSPYDRLINLAREYGMDPMQAQDKSKQEWKAAIKNAVITKAVAEYSLLAKEKNVDPPEKDFKPRHYVLVGGGVAKYGIRYRWEHISNERARAGTQVQVQPEACQHCKRDHNVQISSHIVDLIYCKRLCPDRLKAKRTRVLKQIAEEMYKRSFESVPNSVLTKMSTLQWANQTDGSTKALLHLLSQASKAVTVYRW